MDRKMISVFAVGVGIVTLAVACVAATSQLSATPLYTVRMEQASSKMNFLPTAANEFMYTSEKGYTLSYDAAGWCGAHFLNTGDPTCPTNCPDTCNPTCDNPTCPVTCHETCNPTCDNPTCPVTCGETHWKTCSTCEETCEHTCPLTCDDITCLPTCSSGFTCLETCPDTCPVTCDDVTAVT